MMKLLRRHRDWLMIVIAILAIPFVFYFVQRPDYGAMRADKFARIYDRNVSMLEAQQIVRLLTLPAFRGDSGFDMKKFTDFAQNWLAPNGLTEEHIEQLVRDQLSLNQIKRLLAAGVTVPKGELDENFERGHDTLSVTVVRFQTADFGKDINVSDEDVQKHFDAHKAELKTDEKRKVEFVSLALTDEEKKLTGKERIDALQKLSDRATDFTQALLEKGADFKQAASKFQLPVHETGEFTKAEPDPQLKADAQLGSAAFKLSMQEPNSDPVQVADGFYILHLAGITEARPLTLEEAKPKIVDTIKKSKARELMSTKGAEVVQQLREAKNSGQPLEAAIQKVGGKAEKVPPFSIIEEEKPKSQDQEPKKNEPADLPAIKQAVAFLNAGEVSDFLPASENGFIAILDEQECHRRRPTKSLMTPTVI